jgi:hypothetical protein
MTEYLIDRKSCKWAKKLGSDMLLGVGSFASQNKFGIEVKSTNCLKFGVFSPKFGKDSSVYLV